MLCDHVIIFFDEFVAVTSGRECWGNHNSPWSVFFYDKITELFDQLKGQLRLSSPKSASYKGGLKWFFANIYLLLAQKDCLSMYGCLICWQFYKAQGVSKGWPIEPSVPIFSIKKEKHLQPIKQTGLKEFRFDKILVGCSCIKSFSFLILKVGRRRVSLIVKY